MGFSMSGIKYIINKVTYSKSELKQFIILNNYKIKWHIISVKHFCGSINYFYVQKQLFFKISNDRYAFIHPNLPNPTIWMSILSKIWAHSKVEVHNHNYCNMVSSNNQYEHKML